MEDKEKLRNMKRKMYSNLEGFLKDWEDFIKEKVEHKHQASIQCAREASEEEEREKILSLIRENIKVCYRDLLQARNIKGYREDWIEGFRSRLDGLILIWHEIKDITFIDACKELKVKYEDVNTS